MSIALVSRSLRGRDTAAKAARTETSSVFPRHSSPSLFKSEAPASVWPYLYDEEPIRFHFSLPFGAGFRRHFHQLAFRPRRDLEHGTRLRRLEHGSELDARYSTDQHSDFWPHE